MKRLTLLSSGAVIALSYTIVAVLKGVERRRRRKLKASLRQNLLEGVSQDPEFDVIIIGGGTAGCVLAARLSENSNLKVLVLEAGRSGVANEFSRIPGAGFKILRSKDDYGLFTKEQSNAGGRRRYWPRAKLLGGCSSINAMIFHEGAPSDYDEWAEITGDDGWSYENFKQYFLKFEQFVPSKDHQNVNTSLRGTDGPVQVGFFGHFSKLAKAFITSCEALGIPKVADLNTPEGTMGVTKLMTYIDSKGERVTTESAYFTWEVLSRQNLTVVTNAQVTRIIMETDEGTGTKRAAGVEFVLAKDGARTVVRSRKEIVLCAGAVHTPHILMLSGIGPAQELDRHSIAVVHDLQGVGQHLKDHVVSFARFRCKAGLSLNFLQPRSFFETLKFTKAVIQYKTMGTGPLTHNIVDSAAFVRSDDPWLFPNDDKAIDDSSSGSNAPDIELLSSPMAWDDHGFGTVPFGDLCSIGPTLLRPTSTGSITLNSSDPFEHPVIDPNYLATQHDLDVLVRGLQLTLRIARTEPYASLLDNSHIDPFFDNNNLDKSDTEELAKIIRSRLETVYHPCCSARMAPLSQGGVVDASLRVYGVEGLRIADASVFPSIVSGHTTAPVIAIAEKAADLIKHSST